MTDNSHTRLLEYAPPAYDDVVNPSPEDNLRPSAPPQHELGHLQAGDYPASVQSHQQSNTINQSSKFETCIEKYISYSVARHLRKYILPKTEQEDPELDVEAQFSRHVVRSAQMAIERKKRLQCVSGWLWCFGVVLVLAYIVLPAAMIAVGVVGIGDCPFRSNTLIIYIIGGGILLALLVSIRTIPTLMTCIKNRNYFSTGNSKKWGGCICVLETFFYIFLVLNIIALILGTYTTFAEGKPGGCSTPSDNCCEGFVYIASATFTVFQYVLYIFSSLFVCLELSCIRSMDKGT